MLPHQDEFAAYVGKKALWHIVLLCSTFDIVRTGHLGIKNEDHVVVYDSYGIYCSPRVWWMFRAFGHENASVLDGGLLKWGQEGRPTESGIVEAEVR